MAVIDNLMMDKEEMESAINAFEMRKVSLENAYLKVSNAVRVLDGTWHGASSEKFKSQFDELYKNLAQCETVMSNVISKVKTALQTYEGKEADVTSKIQGLEEGTAYQPVM